MENGYKAAHTVYFLPSRLSLSVQEFHLLGTRHFLMHRAFADFHRRCGISPTPENIV